MQRPPQQQTTVKQQKKQNQKKKTTTTTTATAAASPHFPNDFGWLQVRAGARDQRLPSNGSLARDIQRSSQSHFRVLRGGNHRPWQLHSTRCRRPASPGRVRVSSPAPFSLFIPPIDLCFSFAGKEPKGEERKLYLAIESLNELAVDRAKIEIQRLIKEELVRLQNSYQPQSKGRYKLT